MELLNDMLLALNAPVVWLIAFVTGLVTRQVFGAALMAFLFSTICTIIHVHTVLHDQTLLSIAAPAALVSAARAAIVGLTAGELTREDA